MIFLKIWGGGRDMTLNSTNDPGFALPNLGAMSFQCLLFRKSLGDHACLFKQGGEKEKKKQRIGKKKKRKEKWGGKKKLLFKSKQLSDLLHTCHE